MSRQVCVRGLEKAAIVVGGAEQEIALMVKHAANASGCVIVIEDGFEARIRSYENTPAKKTEIVLSNDQISICRQRNSILAA